VRFLWPQSFGNRALPVDNKPRTGSETVSQGMKLELTDLERDFLRELLEEKQARLIQEIDHTDTRNFEELLKKKLEILEGLKRKLEGPAD